MVGLLARAGARRTHVTSASGPRRPPRGRSPWHPRSSCFQRRDQERYRTTNHPNRQIRSLVLSVDLVGS
jgi:hypothetical protein